MNIIHYYNDLIIDDTEFNVSSRRKDDIMRTIVGIFQLVFYLRVAYTEIYNDVYIDNAKIDMLADIVTNNLKGNGWINLLFIGELSDRFYNRIKHLPMTVSHSKIDAEDQYVEDAVPYHSNVIIISCINLEQFQESVKKTLASPYWHPLSNIIVFLHSTYDRLIIAKVFYTLWFYKGLNTIIIQADDLRSFMQISYFSPYLSDDYRLQYEYGCYTRRKVGMPIKIYNNDFVCDQGCHNVSLQSVLRAKHLGTCIGVTMYSFNYTDRKLLTNLNLFEDKTKDMRGFVFKAFIIEVPPFFKIRENPDGTFGIYERDGLIWAELAKLLNFKIDLSKAKEAMIKPFSYDFNVQKIFEFTERKADLILFPVYQFDLIIAKLDNTFPFMESGVCFMSYRAPFETFLFDVKLLQSSYTTIIEFLTCFICLWFVFYIYSIQETRGFRSDQIGKDFLNVCRMVLSYSLYNPPKRPLFRIFLAISIWSFFIINFSMQARIISLFSSSKRGKNVDTFEDIIEKGYIIEGIGSPDAILPDDEERFRKINAKLLSNQDIFECIENIKNDSKRFCLMDCALGRYLELNLLNEKGEQFLHVAQNDRMHSLYLNMILQLHSPLLEHYNEYMMALFEGGIIRKWMEYRYKVVGEDVPVKVLSMEDLEGIFQGYLALLGVSSIVFVIEIIVGNFTAIKQKSKYLVQRWKVYIRISLMRIFRKKQKSEMGTQTNGLKEYDYNCYRP